MSRPNAYAILALAALAFGMSAAAQQVYKWKDANGVTHFAQTPPATGSNYQKVQINGNTVTPVATPASAASAAKPAAQPAPASTAKTPDTAANRAKLCKDLDSNIALLNGSQPLTSGDATTPQQNMSDDQRRQELATARAQKSEYCVNQ